MGFFSGEVNRKSTSKKLFCFLVSESQLEKKTICVICVIVNFHFKCLPLKARCASLKWD